MVWKLPRASQKENGDEELEEGIFQKAEFNALPTPAPLFYRYDLSHRATEREDAGPTLGLDQGRGGAEKSPGLGVSPWASGQAWLLTMNHFCL